MDFGFLKWGDGNDLGLEFVESGLEAPEVLRPGQDDEIHIAAKFRSSVTHAGLPAHEQAADAMTLHRRKDCLCRVLVQVSLQVKGRLPTADRIPSSAPAG